MRLSGGLDEELQMRSRRAFTLIELLVVIAILSILLAILSPALRRAIYLAKSTQCGSNKRQIALAMMDYASDYEGYFPPRHPSENTTNHPYWYSHADYPERDLHELFEEYFGPPVEGGPPPILLCAVNPQGIWGVTLTWPYGDSPFRIYRTNVCLYAGYDWATTNPDACVPLQPLEDMPQRMSDAPHRPLAGDLTEYMTGNSVMGFTGWDTAHAYDSRYHVRNVGNPEELPADGIPYVYGDGSVRVTSDLEECYVDDGWGTNYWPVP